jgi:glycosyltransferase involved in cell wall biosynthesis
MRIAFASTYPPRHCGIATFTRDLSQAMDNREIVALTPPDHVGQYPTEVHHRVRRDEWQDYVSVARSLDRCRVDAVSIQHEYGIWGGDDGEYVLDFVNALHLPTVTTLHTVLRHPSPRQRRILGELVEASDATVVMSRSASSLLSDAYGVDPTRIDVIPHGVPELPLVDPQTIKPALGLAGLDVILSFGLLGPGKGYESAIAAMPPVVAANPNARYVILGATHPDLIRREGEAYRQSLIARVAALGLSKQILFVDRYVGRQELGRWLEAADVFVTPYPNLEQIVSGTLSYAMSAGKAVVSTPYAYAVELLAGGRGVLVEPGSSAALSAAFIDLLGDPDRRAAVGRRAYEHSRRMIWSEVGAEYQRVFARVAAKPVPASAILARSSAAYVDA